MAVLLVSCAAAFGQAPPNDNFANAITLNGPIVTVMANNTGATKQFGQEPFFAANIGGASLWWNWTASASGVTTIDTVGSDFNTILGVFTGPALNQLSFVADNDNFEGQTSRVQFNAVAGTTYRIVVDGSSPPQFPPIPARGNIKLNVRGVGGLNIDTPTNGMVVTFGDVVPITVSFDTNFPSPPASQVDFYVNGSVYATDANAPFSVAATNLPAGSNSIFVVATNSVGMAVQSGTLNILVQNVGITLLTPFDGSLFATTNPITVNAWAYLPGGSFAAVDFYVDGEKFAEDFEAPYRGIWTNLTAGSHRLTAIGWTSTGDPYVSQTVNIGVAGQLIPRASVWRYLDNGSDQGSTWTTPEFDDNAWSSGLAELGYGDGDEATVVSFGPDPAAKYITTYFRRSFNVGNLAAYTNLLFSLERDDAAVVHLNGREVFRSDNLPARPSPITYTTPAGGAGTEDTIDAFALSVTNLVEGLNTLAVEVHQQSGDSSDVSFALTVLGIPHIVRNQPPEVALTQPPTNSYYLVPASLTLTATATDIDGTVAKVEFYSHNVKIGEATTTPFTFVWNYPPVGSHILTAVATDDQNSAKTSAEVEIVIYNASATPVARLNTPVNGTVLEGPTNLLLTASAHAIDGITNVQFLVNGVSAGNDATAPYSVVWPSIFGTNQITVVALDVHGVQGVSAVNTLVVTIPPTNVIAPTIAIQSPHAFADITNLTRIAVTFSENVQNVDAHDLLLNGIAATGLTGRGSNYFFTFPQPPYGQVEVSWDPAHGITDFGYPAPLPFDDQSPTAHWVYQLNDIFPPVLIARSPLPGVTLSNLTQVSVSFSEPVMGVNAADLLVSGVPAYDLVGAGSNYVFIISQPPSGPVNITWASDHGITDLAQVPNPFNGTGPGATWSLTFDARMTLVESNATWRLFKGRSEASSPTNAWRQVGFDDSSWSTSAAPFYFGDPYNTPTFPGTLLSDMQNSYSSIYLRYPFNLANRSSVATLMLHAQSDDGFIAWVNGTEVMRYNVSPGEKAFNGTASAGAPEPTGSKAGFILHTLTNAHRALVNGANVLTIQAFNLTAAQSDFGFNAQLFAFTTDAELVAPNVSQVEPVTGDTFYLTNITINFNEDVSGVDANDLLINGQQATGLTSSSASTYTFSFQQPNYGPVTVTWKQAHGISDLDAPPKPFNAQLPSANLFYVLINPSNPRIEAKTPLPGRITNLTSINITFTEPVVGIEASDLLVAGVPAASVSSSNNITFTFGLTQPPFGPVSVRWAVDHGITDAESPGNGFDVSRFGAQWDYTLVNPIPSVTITSPTNNTYVLAPAEYTIRTVAQDNDGTIARVEFYANGSRLGQATNFPYNYAWSGVPENTYVLHAVVTDNVGLTGTSAPVILNVVTNLPIVLMRGPYLQIGTPTSGIIRWRTDNPSDALVLFGTDPSQLTSAAVELTVTNNHIVQLTGLQPDTKYYYSIGSSLERVPNLGSSLWFVTAPVPGVPKPVRMWVLGDSGTANNNARAVRDAYYNWAESNGPADIWLMLGDNAYNSGTDSEHQGAVFDMYPETLRNLFLWPTIGNHETAQSTTVEHFPYLDIFSLPEDGQAGGVASGTEHYYSFDYANVHFVCLDSMTSGRGANTPMAEWLHADLQATAQDWIIVFFHHPPYTKGSHNSDSESDLIQIRGNLLPILESYGVDLVLSGHSHCYERSYLLHGHYGLSTSITAAMMINGGDGREDGDGSYVKNALGQGVVYSVAGSGGQISGGSLNHAGHFISLNELGSVIIDVVTNRMDMIFLTSEGTIEDRFTLLKNGPPAALAFESISLSTIGTGHVLRFPAYSNVSYTVEQSSDLVSWSAMESLGNAPTNRMIEIIRPNNPDSRYYRLRSP